MNIFRNCIEGIKTKSIKVAFFIPLAITALTAGLYFLKPGYLNVERLQLSFAAVAAVAAAYLTYMLLMRKLDTHTAAVTVMAVGIALRFCYTLYTGAGTRTYDVYRHEWGHLDYIKYIAEHHWLPPVNSCQAYHPPVHHIISAVVLNTGKLFTLDEFFALKLVQLVMAVLNSLTLIFFYKTLRELKVSGTTAITAVSVFAFHPTNIYFASRINNDNTMLFFYAVAFYYLIKWLNKNTFKNIVMLALFLSLAILTKKSAVMLAFPAAAAFLATLARNRGRFKAYLKQFMAFGLVSIPLSVSHQLRNFILFGQSFGYVPSFGVGFIPSTYNLLYLPVDRLLKDPFNNGGIEGGEFFLEFLLKSSLFGEWRYPGLEDLATILILLSVANVVILLTYIFMLKKEDIGGYEFIFLINLAVPFILAAKFRTDFPVACSQDFRYIAPVLISAGYFLGKAVEKVMASSLVVIKCAVTLSIAAFCILSTVFVLSLGHFN